MAKLTPELADQIDGQGTITSLDGGGTIISPVPEPVVGGNSPDLLPPPTTTTTTTSTPTVTPLPVTTTQWVETQYNASPLDSSLLTVLSMPPFVIHYIGDINYSAVPPKKTFVWEKDIIFSAGTYRFQVQVDDGFRIYIDGNVFFESWKTQSSTYYTKDYIATAGTKRVKIVYFNHTDEGIISIKLVPISTTTTTIPTTTTPTPTGSTTPTTNNPVPPPPSTITPPPAPPNVVDLRTIIKFSVDKTSVNYVKNSLKAIASYNLGISNISNDIDVQLAFKGISGISFTPATLTVNRNSTATSVISYNVTEINKLAEGLNIANIIVNLSANNVVAGTSPTPSSAGPSGGTDWYNATKGIYTSTLPTGAIICPPGTRTYYLSSDPAAQTCLKSYSDSLNIDSGPLTTPGTLIIPEGATTDSTVLIYPKADTSTNILK